jgi:hypothetical protein
MLTRYRDITKYFCHHPTPVPCGGNNNWHSFDVALIKTLPVIVSTACQSSMMPRKRAFEDEDDNPEETLTGLPQRDL